MIYWVIPVHRHHLVQDWLSENLAPDEWTYTPNALDLTHPYSGGNWFFRYLPVSVFAFEDDEASALYVRFKLTFADIIAMQFDHEPVNPIPYDNILDS
jgi:hypothetical protein